MNTRKFGPVLHGVRVMVVAILSVHLSSLAAAEPKEGTKLDPAVVATWEKRGAVAGWHGRIDGGTPVFRHDAGNLIDALPAFQFAKGDALDLSELPAVSVPFAIEVQGRLATPGALEGAVKLKNLARLAVAAQGKQMSVEKLQKLKEIDGIASLFWFDDMTPAQAKEIRDFKSLKWLYIQDTFMRDEALKELNGQKTLTYLGTIGTPNLTAAGWQELKSLPALTVLDVNSDKLTDAVLKEWTAHKSLVRLNLKNSQITNAGLQQLKEFPQLAALELSSTKVSDTGIKSLKGLKTLTHLDLNGTLVTDAGVKELKELEKLASLSLNDTKVTDAALKELKNLKQLKTLHLGRTKVTNAGLKDLKELTNLKVLTLYYTQVTDEGIEDLKTLINLEKLDLNYTPVSEEGKRKLREALPRWRTKP